MKNIITLILLALATFCAAQSNQVKTPGVSYSAGAPNWVPVVKTASELAIDTVAKRLYLWNRNTGAWDIQGQGIDNTSGGTPPAYTPGQTDSKFAINNASPPELFAWTGSAWAKVGGTVQTIDTFSISGQTLSVSLSGDAQPAKQVTLPASGITALTGDVTASGPGSAVATIANGAVTAGKLASMGASAGQVLGYSGSAWGPVAAGWGLNGNAATAGSSFLGTTNLVSLALRTNNVQRMKIDSLGNIGIGINAPLSLLHIRGSGSGSPGRLSQIIEIASTSGASSLQLKNGNGRSGYMQYASSGYNTGEALSFFTENDYNLFFTTNGSTPSGGTSAITFSPGGYNSEIARFQQGKVGIGTTTPAARLHVVGAGNTSATWTAQFHNSTGTNNALMVRDDGNVGVGTNSPSSRLEILSASNQAVNNVGGLSLSTPTDATVGLQQWSPPLVLRGRGWKTDATAASQTVDIALVNIPEQGTANPSGGLSVRANFANLGWNTEIIRFTPGLTQFGNSLNLRTINAAGAISTSGERYEWRCGIIGTVDAYAWSFLNGNGSRSAVSGTNGFINFQESFTPTSGTGAYQFVRLRPVINQTGGANGVTYGLFIDPLLTSAFDYRSVNFTNNTGWGIYGQGTAPSYFSGDVRVGTTTAVASAALDVSSTTKGFLPPRMTAVQASAIASPAEGLMVYVTNTNGTFLTKGWYGYNGATWEKLNN